MHCGYISVFFAGLQWDNIEVLKVHNVLKVPALPKKPVPEEKVSVPVPVTKKAPPPRGRISLWQKICYPVNSRFFPFIVCLYWRFVSLIEFLYVYIRDVSCHLFSHFVVLWKIFPKLLEEERMVKFLDF